VEQIIVPLSIRSIAARTISKKRWKSARLFLLSVGTGAEGSYYINWDSLWGANLTHPGLIKITKFTSYLIIEIEHFN